VGDAADAILGYYLVIRKARGAQYVSASFSILTLSPHTAPSSRVRFLSRIPWWLTQRMILNLAVATSIGLVPFLGDVLLAAYRANSRNAALPRRVPPPPWGRHHENYHRNQCTGG